MILTVGTTRKKTIRQHKYEICMPAVVLRSRSYNKHFGDMTGYFK